MAHHERPSYRLPMRPVAGIRITIVLICFGLTTPALAQQQHESRESQQIRALLNGQVAAWNRQDLEGFMSGYWHSPDLTFFSNTIVTSGWQDTLDRYIKRYRSQGPDMGQLEFLDLKIEVLAPRAAFVRGRYHLKIGGQDSTGLFTLTLKKMSDGWKIIHDHTSSAQ